MSVTDIIRVVHLHQQTAGLGGNLEETLLQVPVPRGVPAEEVPEFRHRRVGEAWRALAAADIGARSPRTMPATGVNPLIRRCRGQVRPEGGI